MLLEHENIAKKILPYVEIAEIEPYKAKCRAHAESISEALHQNDISLHRVKKDFYVRDIDEIIYMASYGKLLEVAYCMIFGLDPDEKVDFETRTGPDQYDIEFNESCLVDVTSGRIQDILVKDENNFSVDLHIREAKYDRTIQRISDAEAVKVHSASVSDLRFKVQPKYLANKIAFLQRNTNKIFYIGEMSTLRFEDKPVTKNPDECAFYYLMSLVGRKEIGNSKRIQLF